MGDNTLTTKSANDIISEDDVNQYKSAFNQDVVPRNTSGVATDVAGGLGTTLLRWATSYIQKIFIGSVSNNNTIEEVANDLEISSDFDINLDAGSGREIDLRFAGTALGSGITASGINRDMLGDNVAVQSANIELFQTTSSTFITVGDDITPANELSRTITTNGSSVHLALVSSTGANLLISAASGDVGEFGFFRDSTQLSQYRVNNEIISNSFTHIDSPSAGTYTYTVKVRRASGTTSTIDFEEAILIAYEI